MNKKASYLIQRLNRILLNGSRMSGFTLLEIILALSILATIGIVTINILSDQIATRRKIGELNNDEHSLNAALIRITKDLQGAYLPDQKNIASLNLSNRPVPPQFYLKKDNLIFFTMAFTSYLNGSNESNQAFVRYHTQTDLNDSNKKQLIRVVDTNFIDSIEQDDVGLSQILLSDIEDFSLEFWDGNDFQKDWNSQQTQNKLPKLVKIHLSSYASEERGNKVTNSNEKRKTYILDTIVYLTNTQGQKEVNTPSWTEYKWN